MNEINILTLMLGFLIGFLIELYLSKRAEKKQLRDFKEGLKPLE